MSTKPAPCRTTDQAAQAGWDDGAKDHPSPGVAQRLGTLLHLARSQEDSSEKNGPEAA